MTSIPATARGFERWYSANRGDWPAGLRDAGHRAMNALKTIDQPSFPKSEAMKAETTPALMAFAEVYGAWKASG